VLEGYQSHVIDGLILSPMAITAEDLASHSISVPTVLLGERIHEGGLLHVSIDNVAAGRVATTHLLDTGHRRIAAVGAAHQSTNVEPPKRRMLGYETALREAGLEPDPELSVVTGGWAWSSGYAAVDAFLRREVEVDAMFCFNDVLALATLRALAHHGLRVPDDIAVVGLDDIEEAAYSSPSLSTISPDKEAIARTAVERLLAQIEGEASTMEEVTCSFQLVVRESSTAVVPSRSMPH